MTITVLLVAAIAAAPESTPSHDATVRHDFADVEHWSEVFDDPARDGWQKPEDVIRHAGVATGMTVADLGAGTGYFSVRLARAVGSEGRVLAIDVEPNLVEHIRLRAAKDALPWIAPILTAPDDPKLPSRGVDVVLIVDTWHHIDARDRYLGKIAAGLKPGGTVTVVDFKQGEFPVGPPDAHKLPPEVVVREFTDGGWTLVRRSEDLPYQYLLVFAPPEVR